MNFYQKFEATRFKHLLLQATTANQKLFEVQRRDVKTLLTIIKRNVNCESDID